jgi:predicted permease
LPYPEPDQLVVVWSKIQNDRNVVSAGDFTDWKGQATSFQDLNAWTDADFNLATADQPEHVDGLRVTPGFYRMMGNEFFLGRDFLPEEGQAGKDHVVILTHKMWQRLGANSSVLGTTMRIDGEPYTVVGVLAAGIADRGQAQLAVPLVFEPAQLNHTFHRLLVFGRLKPGVTIRQAQADMNTVAAHIADSYPSSNKGWGAYVEPYKNDFLPSERRLTLWLLMGAVGFVLLIACVNVANLLLAKGMARQKELAIRGSLGATPREIFGQMLTESLLLATTGGLLGVAVGYLMLRGLIASMPFALPTEVEPRLNLPILVFTLAATTVAGLLFGCVPAWFASQVDPADALKEGGRTGTGVGHRRLRRGLVVGEFALALALLAGAGLAIHSFTNLLRVDVGVRTDHVFTFYLPLPDSRSKDPDQIVAYYHRLLAGIAAVPGVSHVSASSGLPLEWPGFGTAFTIAGHAAYSDPSQRPGTLFGLVTPDYFQTFGIHLVKGRLLSEQDGASSVKVAVVNEEFVAKFLKGTDPLEQRVVVEQFIPGVTKRGPPIEWQIVGVVHNVRYQGFRQDNPEVDVPFWQSPWSRAGIGVRTAEDPASMTKSIAAAVHAVDPEIALAAPRTMDQIRDSMLANDRFMVILFASFAAIALLLASVGIYGVMAFSVAQRSHEIAVRAALGANKARVIGLVLREGGALAGAGLVVGLVGAYLVGRLMRSVLFGVGAMDPAAFGLVALILLFAALLACYLPAAHAASVEPLEVLRAE